MNRLIKFRHNTAAAATSSNPVLEAGEPGAETDTGQMKLGNGTTAWNSLPYVGATAVKRFTYLVDNYGTVDYTGASASDTAVAAAITAMGTNPGILEFGKGTIRLNSTKTLARPGQGIRGQGSGLTKIDYRGSGDCFRIWDSTATAPATPGYAGPIVGFTISGWSNSNSNICGLHIGDLYNINIRDVDVVGFGTSGSAGSWFENVIVLGSERAHAQMNVEACTTAYLFDRNTSNTNSYTSWDYGDWDLTVVADVNQHGIVIRNNSQVMGHRQFALRGNFNSGASNTGVVLTIGKDGSDISELSGPLSLACETDGGVGIGHKDINIGAAAKLVGTGMMEFITTGGVPFVAGTASRFTAAFSGHINSPSLGQLSGNQAWRASGSITNQPFTSGTAGSAHTLFLEHGNVGFLQLLSGAQTLALDFSAVQKASPGQATAYDVMLAQPGSGAAGTVTWSLPGGVSFYWFGGSAPTLSTTNGNIDYVRFVTTDHVTFFGIHLTSKTLTSPRIDVIKDVNGKTSLDLPATSSAVNYMQVNNSATGQAPGFTALGTDSNISMIFVPKGSGQVAFWANSQPAVGFAVNGTNTDIDINMITAGAGRLKENGNTAGTWVSTPATATSTGKTGQMAQDGSFFYICTATNTWRRAAIASW